MNKRRKNVEEAMNTFMSYFLYHGVFFLVLSCQNYYFYSEGAFQFCFLILVVFYIQFVIKHVADL